MDEIVIDVNKTIAKLRRPKVVSWSQLKVFKLCPMSWMSNYFAELLKKDVFKVDQTLALAGSIIQKLFETFVNNRVYLRPEMCLMDDILQWFQVNTKALFHLMAFNIEDQYKLGNPRQFFSSGAGVRHYQEVVSCFKLDTTLSPEGIHFINRDKLIEKYGSVDSYIEHIFELYKPVLSLFVETEIDLNRMLSEVPIKVRILRGISLYGVIDFVYNTADFRKFEDINEIRDHYNLIDGKYQFSSYVDEKQLSFYATLIYLKYGKLPRSLSFLSWKDAKFKYFNYDLKFVQELKESVYELSVVQDRVMDQLLEVSEKYVNLYDIDCLSCFSGYSNCMFCQIREMCSRAYSFSWDSEEYNKRLEKLSKEMGAKFSLSPGEINDVTF